MPVKCRRKAPVPSPRRKLPHRPTAARSIFASSSPLQKVPPTVRIKVKRQGEIRALSRQISAIAPQILSVTRNGRDATGSPSLIVLAARLRARVMKNPITSARKEGEPMEREGWCLCFPLRYARFANSKPTIKRKRNADKRGSTTAASSDAALPPPLPSPACGEGMGGGSSPVGVPPRLSSLGVVVPRLNSGQASCDSAGALDP